MVYCCKTKHQITRLIMPTYEEIKLTADNRWQRLTAGKTPWIRIGTAICGHAAGAYEVIDTLNTELAKNTNRNNIFLIY